MVTPSWNTQVNELAGIYTNEYNVGNTDTKMFVQSNIDQGSIVTNGHYGYPRFPDDRNVGGALLLDKVVWNCESGPSVRVMGQGAYSKHHYIGKMYGPSLGGLPFMSTNDGSAWGATAYQRMKPTKPVFPGLNAIYELREVPEMLRQRFLKSGLKAIPNYWLALQFGWQPLLNDILNTVTFQRQAQKKLAWLLKHNGKPTHSRVVLQDNSSTSEVGVWNFTVPNPGFVNQFYRATPYAHVQDTVVDRVWASARWRFWLPPGPQDINWTRAMMARLYGLYPSPAAVWNALPWTWMIDWFANAGDILQNMDIGVANSLAADYFYVMREQRYERRADCFAELISYPDGSPISVRVSSSAARVYKSRVVGDPFGWNTNQSGLSPMQLSILGSLGMSRLR